MQLLFLPAIYSPISILKVPDSFYDKNHSCGNTGNGNDNKKKSHETDLGTYCQSKNEKCGIILDFLKLNGRSLLTSNLQILREDALKSSISVFADNFDSLIDKVLYPVYEKRFLNRHQLLRVKEKRNSASLGPNTFDEKKTKLEASIFVDGLGETMKRLFNVFYVLNCEDGNDERGHMHDWGRHIGTTLANLNFLLDIEYENNWINFKKESTINPKSEIEMRYADVATENLQAQLRALLSDIFPLTAISLTDIASLLGYSNDFEMEKLNLTKCKVMNLTKNSTCKTKMSMKINKNLYPIHGLDPFNKLTKMCDINQHLQDWMQDIGISASGKGKIELLIFNTQSKCFEII